MTGLPKLHDGIALVCPIHGVASSGRIDFRDEPTAQQRAAAAAVVADWDFATGTWKPGSTQETLQAERDAAAAAAVLAARRAAAKAVTTSLTSELGIAQRALLLLVLDEINRLRTEPTRVLPAITPSQAATGWQAKIDQLNGG